MIAKILETPCPECGPQTVGRPCDPSIVEAICVSRIRAAEAAAPPIETGGLVELLAEAEELLTSWWNGCDGSGKGPLPGVLEDTAALVPRLRAALTDRPPASPEGPAPSTHMHLPRDPQCEHGNPPCCCDMGDCAETPVCRCGSGLHPRRCAVHPERYAEHCAEISAENAETPTGAPCAVVGCYISAPHGHGTTSRETPVGASLACACAGAITTASGATYCESCGGFASAPAETPVGPTCPGNWKAPNRCAHPVGHDGPCIPDLGMNPPASAPPAACGTAWCGKPTSQMPRGASCHFSSDLKRAYCTTDCYLRAGGGTGQAPGGGAK